MQRHLLPLWCGIGRVLGSSSQHNFCSVHYLLVVIPNVQKLLIETPSSLECESHFTAPETEIVHISPFEPFYVGGEMIIADVLLHLSHTQIWKGGRVS